MASLVAACVYGNVEGVVDAIESGVDTNQQFTEEGNTPLILAVWHRHPEIVKKLVANKADVNLTNHYNTTPLMLAILGGCEEIVKILLAYGADPNQASLSGTPLMKAIQSGSPKSVELLLEYGADLDQRGHYKNRSPMWAAIEGGHTEIVKILLTKTTNINHVNKAGNTPLIFATGCGRTEIVKILLAHNANALQVNKKGYHSLTMARKTSNKKIEHIIREHLCKWLANTGLGVMPRDVLMEITNYL